MIADLLQRAAVIYFILIPTPTFGAENVTAQFPCKTLPVVAILYDIYCLMLWIRRRNRSSCKDPRSPSEWDAYFDLRWRILRQPWGQPRGSERDSEDDSALHLLLMDAAWKALACGRLHLTAPGEAQLRYMAVDEYACGCGYGAGILEALEVEARGRGAAKIVLNARDNAVKFYRKRGYGIFGDAETRFGMIHHVRMAKLLS
jgi:predicted GNAT family N-acyltransferase